MPLISDFERALYQHEVEAEADDGDNSRSVSGVGLARWELLCEAEMATVWQMLDAL